MCSFKLYLPRLNCLRKEGKCMRFMRLLKFRRRSLRNNRKLSKGLKKTYVKETSRYRFISSTFVSSCKRMMPKGKRPNKGSSRSRRSSTKKSKKYRSLNSRSVLHTKSNKNSTEKFPPYANTNNTYKKCELHTAISTLRCLIF